MIGQRGGVFPDRDSRGEIEDVSQNGITLGTRGIRQRGFLPSNENEDENSKQQGIEDRYHSDKERTGESCYPFCVGGGMMESAGSMMLVKRHPGGREQLAANLLELPLGWQILLLKPADNS